MKFTLVELLVVMVMVSVLASMLMAGAGFVRKKADQINCMSNMRAISIEVFSFSANRRGRTMPASFDDTTDGGFNHWQNYLISKGNSPSLFLCPSMNEGGYFDPAGHDPATENIHKKGSYIMNIIKPGSWGAADISYDKNKASGWGLDSKTPVYTRDLIAPERSIYILDAAMGLHHNHSGINQFQRTDHGEKKIPAIGSVRWVGSHHSNNGFNALFGDGHCEFKTETEPDEWVVTEESN